MSELPQPLPTTVVRIHRRIKYEVHHYVEEENNFSKDLPGELG